MSEVPTNPYKTQAALRARRTVRFDQALGRAKVEYRELAQKAVEFELQTQGLELCAETLLHYRRVDSSDQSLALFPTEEANRSYKDTRERWLIEVGQGHEENEYDDVNYEMLLVYCPSHAPTPNPRPYNNPEDTIDIEPLHDPTGFTATSGIVKSYPVTAEGGRFWVPAFNNLDITHLSPERTYTTELFKRLGIATTSDFPPRMSDLLFNRERSINRSSKAALNRAR